MHSLLPIHDVIYRLGFAILAGASLGLNRWIHHKSAGVRTHGLVALGSAIAMIIVELGGDANGSSRVLQGILTGVGFLGAGIIIHHETSSTVRGLTTAASIWICALIGASFGAGEMILGGISLFCVLLILTLGSSIEKFASKYFGDESLSKIEDSKETMHQNKNT